MKKCPKCGNSEFLITPHVTQTWKRRKCIAPNVMLKTKDAAPGLIITDPKGDIMTSRLCQLYKEKGYTISLADPDAENVE